MRHRHWTLLVTLGLPLMAVGAYFIYQATKPPAESERRFEKAFAEVRRGQPRLSEEQARDLAIDRAAETWFADLLGRYPWMQVEFREIPDEQNGFLQLTRLLENGPTVPDDIVRMTWDEADYDPAKFEAWASKTLLLEELLRISDLRQCSVKGIAQMDWIKDSSKRSVAELGKVPVIAGRVAMDRGESDLARRHYQAAFKLTRHLDGIEAPSLYFKIVAIGIRHHAVRSIHEHVLPEIVNHPDELREWWPVIRFRPSPAAELEAMLRGEWYVTTEELLLPQLVANEIEIDGPSILPQSWLDAVGLEGPTYPNYEIPDEQAVLNARARYLQALWSAGQSRPLSSVLADSTLMFPTPPSSLSGKGRSLLGMLNPGLHSWLGSWAVHLTQMTLHNALFAISLGESPPLDPVTGKAFIWDPATRTLSPPSGDIDPLVMPPPP